MDGQKSVCIAGEQRSATIADAGARPVHDHHARGSFSELAGAIGAHHGDGEPGFPAAPLRFEVEQLVRALVGAVADGNHGLAFERWTAIPERENRKLDRSVEDDEREIVRARRARQRGHDACADRHGLGPRHFVREKCERLRG
jgi:hypothetical protein